MLLERTPCVWPMDVTPDRLRLSAGLIAYLRQEHDRNPSRELWRLIARAERWNVKPKGTMSDKYKLEGEIKEFLGIL
jgi:hypothetical protein